MPVDVAAFAGRARRPGVILRAAELRAACGVQRKLLLGVDRLDYTKGIDQRLHAIRSLFERGVLKPGHDAYLQIAVPSRADANGYPELRARVERLVGDINGSFADVGTPVVHYLHRSVDADELAAMYLAADVMLVTPFRDGMNLVAKEYVATRVDGRGTLVLSEFAGAADELRDALLVNPHDARSMERVIAEAVTSEVAHLTMPMLRARLGRQSPARWAAEFLDRLAAVR